MLHMRTGMDRRSALKTLASGLAASQAGRMQAQDIAEGPYRATADSLQAYKIPAWFRDAKFGIWSHWGPQSATEAGDWYARNMYIEGSAQYKFHVEHYGHPSKVGFKDVIATFKAEKWNPEHLMDLYQKAGAKYFVSMGVHHDNFDLWNSKYQPHWNAVASGPGKDIVGLWKQAARKRGLRFGVSEHLSNSFDWLATSHRSDKSGPLAGVPYDGTNPQFADLYFDYKDMPAGFANTAAAMGRVAPERWKKQYFARIKDLIDQHQPDLLYTDGQIPFDAYGYGLVAHLYNVSAKIHGGVESVYNSKGKSDCVQGTCALDLERGIVDKIWPDPWQTDTCIGNWHYKKGVEYKSAKTVVDMLVDIVSRNGNLLLNFPLPGSGELDSQEMAVLSGITDWMAVNSEAIYNTRPWTIYGSGPVTEASAGKQAKLEFNEKGRKALTADDVRFTKKGKILYAFVMGWPMKEALIPVLGTHSANDPGKIENIELLGYKEKLKWSREDAALRIQLPENKPCEHAIAFKIALS